MGRAAVDDHDVLTPASGGAAVTTLTRGSVITFTATVTGWHFARNAGSSGLLRCGATYCTDIHCLGTVYGQARESRR